MLHTHVLLSEYVSINDGLPVRDVSIPCRVDARAILAESRKLFIAPWLENIGRSED
ncbi:hypothetical protein [Pontibacter akesuensis]|uniref:hypothetical protein n=1 Tax=Pontibacter akesuensis TaxID=388950 RepID=UPI0015606360|nr:hypothetical protein [Pontibacter akesuensis]